MTAAAARTPWSASPALVAWLLVGLVANLPDTFGDAAGTTQVLLSLAGLAHCVVGFWRDGGRRISAPGVYFYAAALFVYFPGLHLAVAGAGMRHGPLALTAALNFWYFAQLVMHHLVWENRPQRHDEVVLVTDPAVLRWARRCGVVLCVLGTAMSLARVTEQLISAGIAFTGVVLLATASFAVADRASPLRYLLVVAAAGAYAQYVFTGFGRLQLGALGLAVAMAVAHRFRGRLLKAGVLVATVPMLAVLAANRVRFATDTMGAASTAGDTGLESVYSPMLRFAELWHMESVTGLAHAHLRTFGAALVAMVPRELWPGKPVGLGAELAVVFRPEYAPHGHSELALLSGELVFAGGWLGLLVMPVLLAWAVRGLDRLATGVSARSLDTRAHLLRSVAILIVTASVLDLVWGGTFAYTSRVGPRLVVVGLLFVLFAWRRPVRDVPAGAVRQAAGRHHGVRQRTAS